MSRRASLVVRFRMRLQCSRDAIADLWECDPEDVRGAERSEKGDRWIEDRFWFFTGLHWLHVSAFLLKPHLLTPAQRADIERRMAWIQQRLAKK